MSDKETFVERFTSIDRKFPWSFLGFFFGVIFFLAGLYLTIFYSKSAGFTLEVLSENPVYDIKENVTKLEVLFDGENIRQKQQELSLVTIRIANDGNADLPKSAFDDQALPRFSIPHAKIISVDQLHATNDYLSKHAKVTLEESSNGVIQPVNMDAGDSFSFKLLVLHDEAKRPEILVDGKIGGVKNFKLVKFSVPEPQTFTQNVIGGDVLVQFSRLVIYLIGGLIIIIFLGISIENLRGWKTTRNRRKIVTRFKRELDIELPSRVVAVLKHYETLGEGAISTACRLLRDSDLLKSAISEVNKMPKVVPGEPDFRYLAYSTSRPGARTLPLPHFYPTIVRTFIDQDIITLSGENVIIDHAALDYLNRFDSFLLAYAPKKTRTRSNSQELHPVGTDSSLNSAKADTSNNTSPSPNE